MFRSLDPLVKLWISQCSLARRRAAHLSWSKTWSLGLTCMIGDGDEAPMPLCLSSGSWDLICGVERLDQVVDLACDVALEAADGLSAGHAFGGASVEVVAGAVVAAWSGQGEAVEGGVGA